MQTITPSSLKQLFWQKDIKSFPSYLNLWAIEDNVLVGVDLQMSLVYEFEGIDLFLKTEVETDIIFNQLKNLLHAIPENMTLQFVVQVRQGNEQLIEQYLQNIDIHDELVNYISTQKTEHFRKLVSYRKRYLMYLTIYPENTDLTKMSTNIFQILKPDYKKIASQIHQKYTDKLNEIANVIVTSFNSAGIKPKQLNKKGMLNLIYEHLNPGRIEYLDFNSLNEELTLRSQIVYNACENEFPQCFVDGYYYRAVNMNDRPRELLFTYLVSFMRELSGEYDLCFTIHSVNQDNIIKQLQFNSTLATIISTINPFKRYYEAEIKSQHCSELVEYVKNTFQKLYEISFGVVLRDRNLETLTQRTNKCVAEFRNVGEAEGIIDDMNHLYLYLSVLPGHSQYNLRKHIFHTEAVLQMIPLHHSWQGSQNPKMLFLTREQELIGIDLFAPELPAKHGLVLGTTGSGKSFTTNLLLTNFFVESAKNHIVIVDIGGSYRKLCQLFGGEYLEVELSEKYGFNPFPPKSLAVTNSDLYNFEVDSDVVSYLKLLLQKLLKKDVLSGTESFILERAIINTYRYSKSDPPILSNLYFQLEKYSHDGVKEDSVVETILKLNSEPTQIAKRFADDLMEWTSGIKGKMINKRTAIEPKSRMVVFDLQKLQEHKELQSTIIFLIQNVIQQKLYNKSLRKMVVFDECWQLFNDPLSAQLIENLYRTARKFNAMVLSISQSPDDFLASKSAAAVLTNSYTKYILRLQKGHDILDKFGLNQQEIEIVKSLQSVRGKYSEIMAKFVDKSQVLNLLVPKSDYWICTTDSEDYQKEVRIRETNPESTNLEIIKKLVEESV